MYFFSLLLLLLIQIQEILCECRANNTCTYARENSLLTCGHMLANNTGTWKNIQSLKICDYQQNTLNLSDIFRKHHNLTNITIHGGKINSVILDEELVNNMKVVCFSCERFFLFFFFVVGDKSESIFFKLCVDTDKCCEEIDKA